MRISDWSSDVCSSDLRRVVAGVNAERSDVAAAMAADAATAGADAVMVFPPFSWALGADDRAIQAHPRAVASAPDLPLFLFQASVKAGHLAYQPDTLRSEEHTSELHSLMTISYAVFGLKKKTTLSN